MSLLRISLYISRVTPLCNVLPDENCQSAIETLQTKFCVSLPQSKIDQ